MVESLSEEERNMKEGEGEAGRNETRLIFHQGKSPRK